MSLKSPSILSAAEKPSLPIELSLSSKQPIADSSDSHNSSKEIHNLPKSVELSVVVEPEKISPKKEFLDYRKRPKEVQSHILKQFNEYSKKSFGHWVVNGDDGLYNLCNINPLKLVEYIVANDPRRKEFYILDIGAGEFSFGKSMAAILNASDEVMLKIPEEMRVKIPEGVKINIISTRAEIHKGIHKDDVEETQGKCRLYEFGEFQAENLCEEFERRGFSLNKNIDLIVSRMCFTHLVDGPGTFIQAYSLLRPEAGYLLMDGMHVNKIGDRNHSESYDKNMQILLFHTKSPFLVIKQHEPKTVHLSNNYILRRAGNNECEIPLEYMEKIADDQGGKNLNHGRAEFCTEYFTLKNKTHVFPWKYTGDRILFDDLDAHGLIPQLDNPWDGPRPSNLQKMMYRGPAFCPIGIDEELFTARCLEQLYREKTVKEHAALSEAEKPLELPVVSVAGQKLSAIQEKSSRVEEESPMALSSAVSIASSVFPPQRNQRRRKRQTKENVKVPLRWSKRIAAKQKESSENFVVKRGRYRV